MRVWRLKLAPGEESPVHRHDLDHLLIQVRGDRIAVIPEPDSEGPFREELAADVVPGAVVHVRRGGVERARNVGNEPYLEMIVELKHAESRTQGAPAGSVTKARTPWILGLKSAKHRRAPGVIQRQKGGPGQWARTASAGKIQEPCGGGATPRGAPGARHTA